MPPVPRRNPIAVVLALLLGAALCTPPAAPAAADDHVVRVKVIGGLASVSQYVRFEEPFWRQRIGELTGGRVVADIAPFDRSGIRGQEMLQLMRLGVVPFGTVILPVAATEEPELNAVDLPGLSPDIATLRRTVDAFRPHLEQLLRERYRIELLGVYTYPAQVVFCNRAFGGLSDLAGRRVRTSSVGQSELIEALGATPVVTPFAEILPAIRARVVECAITGTLSGHAIGLYEVTTHVHAMALSWGLSIFGANGDAWAALPPELREATRKGVEQLEREIWDAADRETGEGLACNAGLPACTLPRRGQMTIVPVSADDRERRRRLLTDVVLPRWVGRCGPDCVEAWNAYLAPVFGIRAKSDLTAMQATHRLRLAVIAAALLLLFAQAVATMLLLGRSHAAARATALDTANRIGRAVEASINRNFVQVDAMLAGLPTTLGPYVRDGRLDAAGAGRMLRELNNQNFTFRDVLLVGPDSMPLTSGLSVSRRRPLPIPLGPAFVETGPTAGGVAIAGPVRNPATGEWTLFFARQVTMPGLGQLTAVAEVPVPVIAALLAVGGEAQALRVTLERDDGTLLAALPHDETRIGHRLTPVAAELLAEAVPRSRFSGQPILAVVRPTLYPTLAITASIETEAALTGWRSDRDRALLASAAFAALVLALGAALLLWLRSRDKAEAERNRWRARLENALESMSDGFVMFGPDDRLIACNRRYKDFYAISAPFITPGAHFRDILREGALRGQYPQAGPDIEAFISAMDYWRHANNPPIERLLPDGRWVLITERSTPDGGTVGIRTDITQLKRTMEQLATARDAARAAGEAKSQFLARMSHELRTPLNSILGFAQVLLGDGNLTPVQREQVATLQQAGQHLLELVNGLLDLSKIEAGKLELHPREVALRPLLEACAGLLAPEVARKRQRFTLDIAADVPALVSADPVRLRQTLLNLLSNAVKFTPDGGRVEMRAMPMRSGAQGVRFEVQDTGPGIPPDKRHLLFEDFSQLFPAADAQASGTGLGLAISARLATLMGGRIGCDTTLREGALFWVELPLPALALPAAETAAPQAAQPPALASSEPVPAPETGGAPTRPLRVLVADDVAANRMVARAMLVAAGHRVDAAADGAEALAAVQREAYDVVLMDVQMPGMDGLEATRRIRALEGAAARVPVLAVTASALPEQITACHAAGMDGHLAKPIDRASLLAAVARAAAGVPASPPAVEPIEAEPPLLESTALSSLAADLGPTASVVIGEFVGELRLGLATLSSDSVAGDAAQLRPAAHRLLGAARTLGARRLAVAIEALQAALHADAATAQPLRHVLDLTATTLRALEAVLRPVPGTEDAPQERTRSVINDAAA